MPARRAATKKRVKGPNGKLQWVPIDDVLPPFNGAMPTPIQSEEEWDAQGWAQESTPNEVVRAEPERA